jgi:hypothetical protein
VPVIGGDSQPRTAATAIRLRFWAQPRHGGAPAAHPNWPNWAAPRTRSPAARYTRRVVQLIRARPRRAEAVVVLPVGAMGRANNGGYGRGNGGMSTNCNSGGTGHAETLYRTHFADRLGVGDRRLFRLDGGAPRTRLRTHSQISTGTRGTGEWFTVQRDGREPGHQFVAAPAPSGGRRVRMPPPHLRAVSRHARMRLLPPARGRS